MSGQGEPTRLRPYGFSRWAKVTDTERAALADAIARFVPESDELEQHVGRDAETA